MINNKKIIIIMISIIIFLITVFSIINLVSNYKFIKTTVECHMTSKTDNINLITKDKITIKADKEANVIKTEYIITQKYAKKEDYKSAKINYKKESSKLDYKFNDLKREITLTTSSKNAIGVESKQKVWLKSYVDLLKKNKYTCK